MTLMRGLAQKLPLVWLHRGPLAWLLWPVSLLFAGLVRLRKALFRVGLLQSHEVPVPVVVVGNVVAGGSGKTPVVIALVEQLQTLGWRPGVISRGYGRQSRDCREVHTDDRAIDTGDEPLLIKQKTRAAVFVASRRIEAAQALLRAHPQTDVIICDDGLQHLALKRDIDICVFDERGTGNGFLLPAGSLREPWPRKVDLVIHSTDRPAVEGGFTSTRQLGHLARRADGSTCDLADLGEARMRPLAAVAGIAKPEKFFAMLEQNGLKPDVTVPLPDHFDYAEPLEQTRGATTVVCTEKDAIKLWRHAPQAWALALRFELEPDGLNAMLALLIAARDRKLAKLSSNHGSSTT
ncbi:MAG: hypothetical protein RLZZ591_575 [Pseudomonadota bacterium]|jgi:tetraacyldisaccharide 4'-kinase